MKIFIDTAIVEEIKEASQYGIISGVTTNPSLIAKSNRKVEDVIKEILAIVDGPISCEVNESDYMSMYNQAHEIIKMANNPNITIKLPMTIDGIKTCKMLVSEGIKTNVTLIFSVNQALLAANAGATYVSPFLGRVDDISMNGIDLVRNIAEIFRVHNISTEIIAASVRNPLHVIEAARAGADIATVPYNLVQQMIKHPLTDQGLEKFKKDWQNAFSK